MARFKLALAAAAAAATALASVSAPATALEVTVPGVNFPGNSSQKKFPASQKKFPVNSSQTRVTVPGAGITLGPGGVNVTLGQPSVQPSIQPPIQPPIQPVQPPSSPPPGQSQATSTTPSASKPASGGTSAGSRPATSAPSSGGRTVSIAPARRAAAAPIVARISAPTGGAGTSGSTASRASRGRTPRPIAARGPVAGPPSAVERIVERIPSEFLAALCAALLAAIAFALVWIRERRRARQARRVALVDPLTGISNRLAFYERLAHEWGRARRYGRDLGVILLDMDGLKQINDGDGHAAGDRALVSIAMTLSDDIRQSDLAARLAGDEFVVLCPETGGEGLRRLARKLQRRLDAQAIGMSVGVAEYDHADQSPEDLLARADEAMYEDKADRRAPEPAQPTALPALATPA